MRSLSFFGPFLQRFRRTTVCGIRVLLPALLMCLPVPLSAQPASSTTLTITSGGSSVTSVTAGSVVTLTATVTSGGSSVAPGQVTFCDATASLCVASAKLGTVQLQSGTAALNFTPGVGSHSYKAVFAGTGAAQASSSQAQTLTVTGAVATTAVLTATGSAGKYTLTGSAIGVGQNAPTGTISFIDTSNGNLSLGAPAISGATAGLSFTTPPVVTIGPVPDYIVVSDFNSDGKPDMAIANPGISRGGAYPTILLSNGDGSFSRGANPVTTVIPTTMAVGDFNNDGIPDLVVDGGSSGAFTLVLGKGDGSFQVATDITPAVSGAFVAVGDFNGDGNADLAIAQGSGSSSVQILLGHGDGTFASGSSVTTGQTPSYIAVGDFNNDGKLDLAVVNTGANTISVLMGKGDGTFTSSPAISITGVQTVVVGDFNADGKADLLASSNGQAVTLTPLLGNGDGTFKAAASITTDASSVYSVAVADFNGDGKTDFALADNAQVAIYVSNGDGTFTRAVSTSGASTSPAYFPVAAGDFNVDGVPDLATANSSQNAVGILLTQRSWMATATVANLDIPGSGAHNIEASYGGDNSYSASTSPVVSLTAAPIATTLTVSASPNPAASGAQIALTATLSPYSFSTLTTNGETLTFFNGTGNIGSAMLASGAATLNVTSLPVGSDSVTVRYTGDTNFAAAISAPVTVTVSAVPVVSLSATSLNFSSLTVGLTSSPQMVTLKNTSAVALALSSIAASGDFAETNTCGSSVAGGASCTITVTFTPTAGGTRTGAITITDNANGSPQMVSLTGTGSTISISSTLTGMTVPSPGYGASAPISVTPVSGFTGTVSLSCSVAYTGQGMANSPPTCSVAPAQITITGASSMAVAVTVSTTAATSSMLDLRWRRDGAVLAGLLFLGMLRKRRWNVALLALLFVVVAASVTGCGGGGNKSSGSTGNPGTTLGNYNVTVTAMSGGASASTTLPLTVQ